MSPARVRPQGLDQTGVATGAHASHVASDEHVAEHNASKETRRGQSERRPQAGTTSNAHAQTVATHLCAPSFSVRIPGLVVKGLGPSGRFAWGLGKLPGIVRRRRRRENRHPAPVYREQSGWDRSQKCFAFASAGLCDRQAHETRCYRRKRIPAPWSVEPVLVAFGESTRSPLADADHAIERVRVICTSPVPKQWSRISSTPASAFPSRRMRGAQSRTMALVLDGPVRHRFCSPTPSLPP